MSVFIHSIAAAGLSDRPPESNVMPLPTRASAGRSEACEPAGRHSRRTRRGGFAEPWPTPRIPPNPPSASACSSSTSTVTPTSPARRAAISANTVGGRCPGGVLTRSRTSATASTAIPARRTASPAADCEALSTTNVISLTGGRWLPADVVRNSPKAYAPSSDPSATARSCAGPGVPVARARVVATRVVPASARTAVPAARRRASWSMPPLAASVPALVSSTGPASAAAVICAGGEDSAPTPTASTVGTGRIPKVAKRTRSPALPVAPRSARTFASRPPSAASSVSVPPSGMGPSLLVATPITSASASRSSTDEVVTAVTVMSRDYGTHRRPVHGRAPAGGQPSSSRSPDRGRAVIRG